MDDMHGNISDIRNPNNPIPPFFHHYWLARVLLYGDLEGGSWGGLEPRARRWGEPVTNYQILFRNTVDLTEAEVESRVSDVGDIFCTTFLILLRDMDAAFGEVYYGSFSI